MRIAILGGGVMGATIALALRDAHPDIDLVVAEKQEERAAELHRDAAARILPVREAVSAADAVIVAVKPQDVPGLIGEIAEHVPAGVLLISIAAGIPTATFEAALPGIDVVRAMPNTPARIRRGVTGVSAGAECSQAALARASELLAAIGFVVEVDEDLQDAVTALSGSGPAYVFYLAEAMTAAAVELGLDEATAAQMARRTILGAALLLDAADVSATELRRQVTSPNGTTHAAISTFDRSGVAAGIAAGMRANRDRSRELSGS